MKLGAIAWVPLFFIGSFALLYTAVNIPQIEFYTGGIVIALYIAGLFYAWGNTIRQAKRIAGSETNHEQAPEPLAQSA